MVPVLSLWLPILVGAGLVFVASSIIHMVLPYHRSDFRKVPAEDEVRETLRNTRIPPGDYMIPHAANPAERATAEHGQKLNDGPVALLTVLENGPPRIAKNLAQWFVFCLVVGVFAAYVAGRALEPGEEYLAVFRFAGTTAFVGYALALWQNSIWLNRSWGSTVKSTFDGFLYALLTAGAFGWLWPQP